MRHLPGLALTGLVLLVACQSPPASLSPADRDANRAAIDHFRDAVLNKDWDGVSALYADDAILMPPNQPTVTGRPAIHDWLADFPPIVSFDLRAEEVAGVGDLAYVRGRWAFTLGVDGSPSDSGRFLEIHRRQADGTWQITRDIFNSDVIRPE
jgi:ketosteroid isomerase-like protein